MHAEFGAGFRWTVFPLHPEVPEEGMALSDLFPGREAEMAASRGRLRRMAEAEGLAMAPRDRTYNSRKAQELSKWAELRGSGDAFRRGVFRACFAEGRDIGDPDELVRIAASSGLPEGEARTALSTRSFAPPVDADWERCRRLAVTAVPTHLFGGRRLVGFAPYEDFAELVRLAAGSPDTAGGEPRRR